MKRRQVNDYHVSCFNGDRVTIQARTMREAASLCASIPQARSVQRIYAKGGSSKVHQVRLVPKIR